MRRGKAKCSGLSPCHTPFEEALIEVMFIGAMESDDTVTKINKSKKGFEGQDFMEFLGSLGF